MSSTIPTNNDKGQFITWKQKCTNNLGIIEGPRQGLCHVFLSVPKLERHDLKTWFFFFHKVSKTNVPNLQIKSTLCTFKNRGKKIISKFSQQFLGHPRSTNYEFITFFLHLSSKPEQYTVELGISYSIWGSCIEVFLT